MQNFTKFCSVALLMIVTLSAFGQAHGPWKGPKDTITKGNSVDWTLAVNQDRITPNVWITRQNTRGIFNIKVESSYTNNSSPSDTKWATGTTANLKSLSFTNWETAVGQNPPGSVNQNMVLYLVTDSIYIDIKFLKWTAGGGGGFVYERTTDCRTFSDMSAVTCDSFVSPSKKYVWKKTGVYTDTLTNAYGCDSLITINLIAHTQDTSKIFLSGCGQVTMPYSKRKITTSGLYFDTIPKGTVCGRDSFIQARATVYALPTKTVSLTACDSLVSPSGKHVWKKSGVYQDVLKSTKTCDTALTVNLTINYSSFNSSSETACDQYVSAGNKTYTTSGLYADTLQTHTGCDSIIEVDLTVNYSKSNVITPFSCVANYMSPSGRYTWKTNGTYYDTLPTSKGCDSVIEVRLSFAIKRGSFKVTSCDPWMAPSGNHVYTVTGEYEDTVLTQSSCDTIYTITFTKTESTDETYDIGGAINRYHSPSGKYVWTSDGTYLDTIPNQQGCDSVMTFNLTVTDVSRSVTRGTGLNATATGVSYQWLDCDNGMARVPGATSQTFKPSKSGNYAVQLSNQWNSDTSECVSINLSVEDINPFGIKVYPNPNNGHFVVDLGAVASSVNSIEVRGVKGELVYETRDISSLTQINMENDIPSGIYVMKVVGKDFTYNAQLVIE